MSKASILIVEDEAVVAADLADKLERAGYRAAGIASEGAQAIAAAQAVTPDLVLMDIRLAGSMDGIEAAERIRSRHAVPVVYLTAHSDLGTLQRAVTTEPFGYILKPFEERDLTTQIEMALYKHRSEQRLRDSEARYRCLVDSAMDSIVTFDNKGNILSWNPATERMFGYGAEEIMHRHISILVPDWSPPCDDGPETPGSPAEGGQACGVWQERSCRGGPRGSFPVEIAVSRQYVHDRFVYTGILRDISERQRAEAEVRWRAGLLEQTHDAVIVWRMTTGISFWNRGAADLYGWTGRDAAGRTTLDLLQTQFPVPPDEFYRRLAEAGHWYGELRQRTKDGTAVVVESRMVTMADEAGLLVLETNRDATERHAIHQEVCRLNAELERRVQERTQELLRSQSLLRQLAAELTLTEQRERRKLATDLHDYLAQLLVAIRIKVSQSRSRLTQPEADRWLKEAEQMLQQTLDYTRSLVAQLTPMALHEFGLPDALKWLGDQMSQHYRLLVSVDWEQAMTATLPEDQTVLLYQSIRELLINVSKHARVDRAVVRVSMESGRLRIAIEDEGVGYDAHAAAGRIEEHGASPKFGLFSIEERMTALGGSFEIVGAPGKGTTATLTLPLISGEGRVERGREANAAAPNMTKPPSALAELDHAPLTTHRSPLVPRIRVLLVDDHDMVRKGLCSLLQDHPEIVVVGDVADGQEAVALAGALKPDVVIMDVNMPNMDGVEATRRIRQKVPSAVVIGLSMHGSGQHEVRMRESGAAAYLTKDAAADKLAETILRCRTSASLGA